MSDEMLNKIDSKIDKLDDRMDTMDKTLVRHEENLKEHMRRSAANEEAVEILRQEMKPVQAHVQFVKNVLIFLGASASVIGFVVGIIEFIKKI